MERFRLSSSLGGQPQIVLRVGAHFGFQKQLIESAFSTYFTQLPASRQMGTVIGEEAFTLAGKAGSRDVA